MRFTDYIWDFDGMLFDTYPRMCAAFRAALARQGYYVEHTTAANYAVLEEIRRQYGPLEDVLITLCGAGLKSDH